MSIQLIQVMATATPQAITDASCAQGWIALDLSLCAFSVSQLTKDKIKIARR